MFKIQKSIKLLFVVSLLMLGFVLLILYSLLFQSKPEDQQTTLVIQTVPKGAELSIPQFNIKQKSPVTIPRVQLGTNVTVGAFTSGHKPTQQVVLITDHPEQQVTITLSPLTDATFYEELDKGIVGNVNPTYTQLLKTQPFWDMLPHYGDTFLVEYKQSSETIQITTLTPPEGPTKNTQIQKYRQDALAWLEANGAKLEELRIVYIPEIL